MIWGKIISFTHNGAQTAKKIVDLLPNDKIELYKRSVDTSPCGTSLKRMVQQAMVDCQLIIFVGATGIAVRSIAPYLQGKAFDPAVLVVDEQGKFVISLLSGHLGGANEFTQMLADKLKATAIITTATDIRGAFAVDSWAKNNKCTVIESDRIHYISSAILRGENIGLKSNFSINGNRPRNIVNFSKNGFTVALNANESPFENTLHIIPKIIHIGIGCRRDTSLDKISKAVNLALSKYNIDIRAVCAIASVDIKQNEAGILAFCREYNLPFNTFSADELNTLDGEFTSSEFVKKTVNVDNVCERAAVYSAKNNNLLCKKLSCDGVTIAIALEKWEMKF